MSNIKIYRKPGNMPYAGSERIGQIDANFCFGCSYYYQRSAKLLWTFFSSSGYLLYLLPAIYFYTGILHALSIIKHPNIGRISFLVGLIVLLGLRLR